MVALVITIVILLILSGFEIVAFGEGGVFSKAINAKQYYTESSKNETVDVLKASDTIDNALSTKKISEIKDGGNIISESTNTKVTDDCENVFYVPAGFKIANDSATNVLNGIVIEDKNGNQYVWIPINDIIKEDKTTISGIGYKRTDSTRLYASNSDYIENEPEEEEISVKRYGGFYIGRYEAGDKESTIAKSYRTSKSQVTNTVTTKKAQTPYTYVSETQSELLATGVEDMEGYIATSKLWSSYSYDTTIRFISLTDNDYNKNSIEGNFQDLSFQYVDLDGLPKTKQSKSSTIVPTGVTTPKSNIYDLGGNVWEWTTEDCNLSGWSPLPKSFRGGHFAGVSTFECADFRNRANGQKTKTNDIGFRVVIFM